jgi:hypothetical protein
MTTENRVPARRSLLFVGGVIVILASLAAAWFGGVFLINQYAQGKVTEAIKALNLEKNVRYRDANYNLFTGATILYDVEVKLGESVSPVKVAELRIDRYREENGVPMEVNLTAVNFLVTPSCMTSPQMELAMVVTGLNAVKGDLQCNVAISSGDRTLKVRRYAIQIEDLIDATVQLEYDDVNVDNWKHIAQGNGLSVGAQAQLLEQVLTKASFVSLDSELVDLGLTDRIVDWGSRITGSTKEQFRITAQQQLTSRIPENLSAYRAPLAQIFQQRSRIRFSLHPDKPISLTDPVFTDPQALQQRLGVKLEVTPAGN